VTSAGVDEIIAHARQRFEEGLISAGFTDREGLWHGAVPRGAGVVEIIVALPEKFPYAPPRIWPTSEDAAPWSWHREQGGALCIVAEDDHEDLWWAEAPNMLRQAEAWFAEADAGWPNDRPDLDMDRYFEPGDDTRIYIYGEFDGLRNSTVRVEDGEHDTVHLLVGATTERAKPTGKAKGKTISKPKARYAYVADVGTVTTPPRTWADVAALAKLNDETLQRIEGGAVAIIGLIYDRGGHEGLVLLSVRPDRNGSIKATRLLSAADTTAAKRARSGLHAIDIADKSVAIVGVGALGSFIADAVARSGVGRMTLVDYERLVPGNLVRHLASSRSVGRAKVDAIRLELAVEDRIAIEKVNVSMRDARDAAFAIQLLSEHDLVINATADFAVTASLRAVAEATGHNILSAALQNSGDTLRIDVLPPLNDTASLPPSSRPRDASAPDVFEPGCGSPVSPTAPYAVIEAAGATARHAVGLLLGRPVHPAGEVRELGLGSPAKETDAS
jgi:hypothetical protein